MELERSKTEVPTYQCQKAFTCFEINFLLMIEKQKKKFF